MGLQLRFYEGRDRRIQQFQVNKRPYLKLSEFGVIQSVLMLMYIHMLAYMYTHVPLNRYMYMST